MTRSHYQEELQTLRRNLLAMGDTVQEGLSQALRGLAQPEPSIRATADHIEERIDEWNHKLHADCLTIMTLQSPVAGDARLIASAMEAASDMESVGDHVLEIADLASKMKRAPTSNLLEDIEKLGAEVQTALAAGLACWSEPGDHTASLRERATAIRSHARHLRENLSKLTSGTKEVETYVSLLLVSSHLDRIGRHALAVGEQAALTATAPEA